MNKFILEVYEIGEVLLALLLFPIKMVWNIVIIITAICLEVLWIGFVFGSVVGVVLLLIFMPSGFLLPLILLNLLVRPWPEDM